MAGFKITGKGGFHITFENGVTVSVQFHPGMHADNYDEILTSNEDRRYWASKTAEVMAWDANHETITKALTNDEDDDPVADYQTPDQVLAIFNRARNFPPKLVDNCEVRE
ncbi:MAG: hypothetical protein WC262_07195 [Bacteroidales bacterium]|jgi:hypothetical protein